MQGGYFILAARAIGVEANFLRKLGPGDASKLMPRRPRFVFDEVCTLFQKKQYGIRRHPALERKGQAMSNQHPPPKMAAAQ